MTKDTVDALKILGRLSWQLSTSKMSLTIAECDAVRTLNHACRHLAYPDRDIYPKTRKGTKGAPVVSARITTDDLR